MKLNLGCGDTRLAGYVNIDRTITGEQQCTPGEPLPEVATFDLRGRWPYADGAAARAVCHHVLDLMAPEDAINTLSEARRVVQGVLRVSSFDPRLAREAAEQGDAKYFQATCARGDTFGESLVWALTLGGARRQLITPETMECLFEAAGYTTWRRDEYRPGELGDSRPRESWYMEAW